MMRGNQGFSSEGRAARWSLPLIASISLYLSYTYVPVVGTTIRVDCEDSFYKKRYFGCPLNFLTALRNWQVSERESGEGQGLISQKKFSASSCEIYGFADLFWDFRPFL